LRCDVKVGELLIAMDLDRFKADHWWNVVAFAGGVIAVGAVSAQFVAAFLIGLGLLAFGAGEWFNHPPRTEIARSNIVNIYAKTRSNPWKPKVQGILLDALGIALFGFGFFRLFAVPLAP
jgi:hypothetical protein